MSGSAIKWARAQDFGASHLQALVAALAARVGPQGTTWVSQQTLANDMRLKPRQIRRCLAVLEGLDVISRKARSKGSAGRTSDMITLHLHKTFKLSRSDIRKFSGPIATGSVVPVRRKVATGTVGSSQPVLQYQGIVSDKQILSHEGNSEGRVGYYTRDDGRPTGPALRVIAGGAQ